MQANDDQILIKTKDGDFKSVDFNEPGVEEKQQQDVKKDNQSQNQNKKDQAGDNKALSAEPINKDNNIVKEEAGEVRELAEKQDTKASKARQELQSLLNSQQESVKSSQEQVNEMLDNNSKEKNNIAEEKKQDIKQKNKQNFEQKKEIKSVMGDGEKEKVNKLNQENKKVEENKKRTTDAGENAFSPIPEEHTSNGFYFDIEDEKEIENIRDKKRGNRRNKYQQVIKNLVNKIIKNLDFQLPEGTLSRFKQTIEAYLRGVMERIEFENVLTRRAEMGGLGIAEEKVKQVLTQAKNYKERLEKNFELLEQEIEDEKNNFSEQKEKQENQEKQKNDQAQKDKNSINEFRQKMQQVQAGEGFDLKEKKPQATSVQADKKQATVNVEPGGEDVSIKEPKKEELIQKQTESQKTSYSSRVQGPVEELANFNLENFRKLAENAKQSTDKILEKIELLTNQSYEKRAEGIEAWYRSPVYKMYLSLGSQSMEEGKPIEEVIKEKQENAEKTLSMAEFDAIAELNNKLNY